MKRQTACALALTFLISANGAMGMNYLNSAKSQVSSFYKKNKKTISVVSAAAAATASLCIAFYLGKKINSKDLEILKKSSEETAVEYNNMKKTIINILGVQKFPDGWGKMLVKKTDLLQIVVDSDGSSFTI